MEQSWLKVKRSSRRYYHNESLLSFWKLDKKLRIFDEKGRGRGGTVQNFTQLAKEVLFVVFILTSIDFDCTFSFHPNLPSILVEYWVSTDVENSCIMKFSSHHLYIFYSDRSKRQSVKSKKTLVGEDSCIHCIMCQILHIFYCRG